MKRILERRLVEGRITKHAGIAAGVLWSLSVTFALIDLLDGTHDPWTGGDGGAVGRFGLLAGLMATAATMIALAGVVVKVFRVEEEVTRVIAGVVRTEVRSSSSELRELLAKLDPIRVDVDVPAECPFLNTAVPIEPNVPVQRSTLKRARLW